METFFTLCLLALSELQLLALSSTYRLYCIYPYYAGA